MRSHKLSLTLAALLLYTGCSRVGIDTSAIAAVGNDDTYAMLSFVWSSVATTINAKKEPLTSPFSLQLNYASPCPNGGTQAFQGSLIGTDSAGTGSANV